MSLVITKDCFPPADTCHNCVRKFSNQVKKNPIAQKDYKRCGGCHLLTYCDADCQREHWTKVHKRHCRFISGKTQVKNNKHNTATCVLCIAERESTPTQIRSEKSPKTACNIEEDASAMKKVLGRVFGFHEEGMEGHCSIEIPCELPFTLGEVSGQYVEAGGTGLDAMLAHALKILNAMLIKAKEDHRNALNQLWNSVIRARSLLWYDILVSGIPRFRSQERLYNQVKSLKNSHGASNPWWKCLLFSIDIIGATYMNLQTNFYDFKSLEDTRFEKLKLFINYRQSQLQNQAKVSEKKTWSNFMLWPSFSNGSVAVLLPPSTRCQSCYDELSGEVEVAPETNAKSLPVLFFDIGDDGALWTCCAITKNPNCYKDCAFKNVAFQMQSDENQWKELLKEKEIFAIESRDCGFCLKESLSSHRCSACLSVQYCSTMCQKKDLDFHKTVCARWAKERSRRIKGKDGQLDHWKTEVMAEKKETVR